MTVEETFIYITRILGQNFPEVFLMIIGELYIIELILAKEMLDKISNNGIFHQYRLT